MDKEKIDRHSYVFDILAKCRGVYETEVIVEGGEIGLIESDYLLRYLFEKIGQKVIVNTNGTFFDTDRSMLYPYIDKVYWHVAEDACTLKKVDIPSSELPVVPGIVSDDADELKAFIKFNEHIKFGYVNYEYISRPPKRQDVKKRRTACYTLNPFICINLANETIQPCSSRGALAAIQLNEANLINVLTGYNSFDNENIMCHSCYRLCYNHDINYLLERKRKLKAIL